MAKIKKIILLSFALILTPLFSYAAILSIGPANDTLATGEIITVKVLVSSDTPLNAVSGHIVFPTSLFSIEAVSKSGSILNFWVTEPTFSKITGAVHFEGVTLGGFKGGTGTVLTVTLRAINAGSGNASFQSGQILANDGQGTDITSGLSGATFSIEAAKEKPATKAPTPPTEPVVVEEPQRPPSLTPPDIVLGSKYGTPAIIGTSDYSKSQVLLTFVSETGTKIFILGESDESGGFVLLVPNTLKRGKYTVTATMITASGEHSEVSKEIFIEIGNIFSDVSPEVRWMMVLLIIAVVYLFIRTVFHLNNKRHTSRSVRREIREAENAVHKSFNILRGDVSDRTANKSIRKDLDSAEELISNEIKDIDQDIEV